MAGGELGSGSSCLIGIGSPDLLLGSIGNGSLSAGWAEPTGALGAAGSTCVIDVAGASPGLALTAAAGVGEAVATGAGSGFGDASSLARLTTHVASASETPPANIKSSGRSCTSAWLPMP